MTLIMSNALLWEFLEHFFLHDFYQPTVATSEEYETQHTRSRLHVGTLLLSQFITTVHSPGRLH